MPSEKHRLAPLPTPGLADYHCHCDYSIDAEGSIEDYCKAAVERNLAEICFTTHYDTNPATASTDAFIRIRGENRSASPENLEPYVADVRRAHDRFYPIGLSVKLGIEVGWWPGCVEQVVRLKERFKFDHVLCGIHEVDNLCICTGRFGEYFRSYALEQLAEKYYRQVSEAAQSSVFDAIAHLAYYVRFGCRHYGDAVYTAHQPFIDDVFSALKATNTALEINTAAIRHGFHEYYPHMSIINAARRAAVAVSFLGSDAHRPDQVGLDFEAARALMPDATVGCDD